MQRFTVPVRFVRRLPDPVFPQCERHILICAIKDLPEGLPTDPNPRRPRIDRLIWREIRKHLLNEEGTPNTFHLKNKGITLIAKQVNKIDDENVELVFEQGQGIVDGGHTYELLLENLTEIEELNSSNGDAPKISQFIKLEVLTGIAVDLSPEIAGGLNTAVQVQEMSLLELKDGFRWIQDELRDEKYAKAIAYSENEAAPYDARDIIGLLDLFNVFDFPNNQTEHEHPVRAYTSKAQVLANYKKKPEQYAKLRPILKDVLTLHDTIALEARNKHNAAGGKGGNLGFVEDRKRGQFDFLFTGKKDKYRLMGGALFPMLAAFRWMVVVNPKTGLAEWRGGFSAVKELWDKSGPELMRATQGTSDELGRRPHAIGRSRNHWASLHKTVATADLMQRTAA